MFMKHTTTVFLLAMLSSLAPASVSGQARQRDRERERERDRDARDQDYSARIDTTIAFSRGGTVDLTQLSGDIVVTGWARDQVKIHAFAERGRIRTEFTSSRVTLEYETARGRGGDSRYEVTVPVGTRLILRNTSGEVSSKGVKGAIDVSSVSGDIHVEDAADRITIESLSGDVTATRLNGAIRVGAVSGDVELSDLTGDVHVETTSGDVSLARATSKNVFATTVSGEVEYDGSIDPSGRYEFHSHSGTVRLDIPEKSSASVSVQTFSGSFDTDFTVTLQPGKAQRRPQRFEFTLGSGSARVTAETFSGDIVLGRHSRSK
jgi:DUF4097 and DUF4098 domain-containing protein YvlB